MYRFCSLQNPIWIIIILIIAVGCSTDQKDASTHEYNGWYEEKHLNRLAFPIGGLGSGMFTLEGTGALSHFSIRNRPDIFNEPVEFAAIHLKGVDNGSKILEGPIPKWKIFGTPGTGNGAAGDNFTSFLSTATGWGNVGLENGEPFIDVKYGEIPIEYIVVSGEKVQ